MKKDFLFTNPGNNPFLGMENSRSFQKKRKFVVVLGSWLWWRYCFKLFSNWIILSKQSNPFTQKETAECVLSVKLLWNLFSFVDEYISVKIYLRFCLWKCSMRKWWKCSAWPPSLNVCFLSNDYEIYLVLLMKKSGNVCKIS